MEQRGSVTGKHDVYINLLRKELEDATADLPFNVTSFRRLYEYELLVDESGTDYRDNLQFLDLIKEISPPWLVKTTKMTQHF